MSVADPIPLVTVGEKVAMIVSPQVDRVWKRFRQNAADSKEACGVLVGGYSSDHGTIFIEKCTQPGKRDWRQRFGFILKSCHHQRVLDLAFRNSTGTQFYLGTWHTHPCAHPQPSGEDKRDWAKCMKRNPGFEFFVFAIVGTASALLTIYRGTVDGK
jgi:integrative and conjugative element protein (TIGR02256 family)